MATYSTILAWEIPCTEEPGGLQSTVGQDLVTKLHSLEWDIKFTCHSKSNREADMSIRGQIFSWVKQQRFICSSRRSLTQGRERTRTSPEERTRDVACGHRVWAAGNRCPRPLDLCTEAPKGRPSVISWKCSHSVLSDSFVLMDCSPPGSSVRGISQVRTLEWAAISFSRGFFPPRDGTWVSRIVGGFFTV